MSARFHCDECDASDADDDVREVVVCIGNDMFRADLCESCRETTPIGRVPPVVRRA